MKISKPKTLVACAIAATTIGLTGCEFLGLSEEPQMPAQQAEAPPAVTPPVEQPLSPVIDNDYQRPEYPNATRRNPFQPDLEVVQPDDVQTDGEEEQLGPLERFSLNELDLVAIISEVAVPKAMFIDPEGFGHVLKEGDRLGRNSGVLSDIRDNEVEVTETTGEEDTQTRLRTIKLREVTIGVGDDSALSEEEKAALEKLLETEEGRQALEARYRDMALGASAVDGKKEDAKTTPPPQRDPRFQGIAPPR